MWSDIESVCGRERVHPGATHPASLYAFPRRHVTRFIHMIRFIRFIHWWKYVWSAINLRTAIATFDFSANGRGWTKIRHEINEREWVNSWHAVKSMNGDGWIIDTQCIFGDSTDDLIGRFEKRKAKFDSARIFWLKYTKGINLTASTEPEKKRPIALGATTAGRPLKRLEKKNT